MARREENDVRRHIDPSTRRQVTDRSPLHPQARNRNGASPAWERKVSSEGGAAFAPLTPKSRLSSGRTNSKQDDPSEKGPPLPKFGAWNVNDPSSADGFTVIFNKARDEKRAGGQLRERPQSPVKNEEDLYKAGDRSSSNKKWYCCFQPGTAET